MPYVVVAVVMGSNLFLCSELYCLRFIPVGMWCCNKLLKPFQIRIAMSHDRCHTGDRFSYNEVLFHNTAKEAHAAKRSIVTSIAALETAPVRAVVRPFLPKPGQGDTWPSCHCPFLICTSHSLYVDVLVRGRWSFVPCLNASARI